MAYGLNLASDSGAGVLDLAQAGPSQGNMRLTWGPGQADMRLTWVPPMPSQAQLRLTWGCLGQVKHTRPRFAGQVKPTCHWLGRRLGPSQAHVVLTWPGQPQVKRTCA